MLNGLTFTKYRNKMELGKFDYMLKWDKINTLTKNNRILEAVKIVVIGEIKRQIGTNRIDEMGQNIQNI